MRASVKPFHVPASVQFTQTSSRRGGKFPSCMLTLNLQLRRSVAPLGSRTTLENRFMSGRKVTEQQQQQKRRRQQQPAVECASNFAVFWCLISGEANRIITKCTSLEQKSEATVENNSFYTSHGCKRTYCKVGGTERDGDGGRAIHRSSGEGCDWEGVREDCTRSLHINA